ncbi:hypothetical protein HaLaN_00722, partial [Haematococcus lacustris]
LAPITVPAQGSGQHHPALPALMHLPGLSILTRPATKPVTSPAEEQQPIIHTTEEQDEQTMPPSMPKQQQDWATARDPGEGPAGTSLVVNLKHITVTLATWDAVWEVYLDPKWARQRLRLYGTQARALEQFLKQLEEDMAEVSMERQGAGSSASQGKGVP